ncbi:MAG: fimbria/pilus outer membrane usher protein, partial [Enterobacteriaceae bacterium]
MSHLKYAAEYMDCREVKSGQRLSGGRFTWSLLAYLIALQIFSPRAELYFNPRFLADDPAAVADLSGFEKGQEVPPGTYRVDIYLNDGFFTTRDITFQTGDNDQGLVPCLTRGQLAAMGVNIQAPEVMTGLTDHCMPFTSMIEGSTSRFVVGQQRLYLSVPQAFMDNRARDYIPPEMWDQGITAAMINYNLTGSNIRRDNSGTRNTSYLNLHNGLNISAWRLRNNSTWSYSSNGDTANNDNKWQNVNSYLQRDITPLRSRLTLGDSYTQGDIFYGISFRGVQLASDDNMLPDSQRGYAPVIHGIARGTAQVTIKQNGYGIYQNTVPPGPFTINDLYAAGNAGDLQISVKEEDGSTQEFTVPWASVPMLQREGHTRYALTAGEYRSGNRQQNRPLFFQGVMLRGLPASWTLYGGTQLAKQYRAFNLGIG